MKTKFPLIVITLVFSCISLHAQQFESSAETPNSQSAIISIKGMACQEGCADVIASNLKKLEEVVSAEVSFESGEANVNFNRNAVSINSLKSTITNTKVKNYSYVIEKITLVAREE